MVHEAGADFGRKDGVYADLGDGFAERLWRKQEIRRNVLAPLNRIGDKEGAKFESGKVRAAPGFAEAYGNGPLADGTPSPAHRVWRHGLAVLLNTACIEIWNAANMAFSLCHC